MSNNAVSVDEIMRYENSEMTQQEEIAMFQKLVRSGMAWQLQGSYGRTARAMIDAGLIEPH